MIRKLIGFLLLNICVTLASAQGAKPATAKPTLPDIYLITIDTLRADHVRCYGATNVDTPALDALAQDGVRFSQAFTPSPITNTSHTTILTGLLPSVHGVTDFGIPLASTHTTSAEFLKQKKYKTAAFIGAVILDAKTLAPGLDRGFDFFDYFPATPPSKSRWGRVERRGGEVIEHAEKWLSTNRIGPHFVWAHLYDPHDPYEAPAPFSEKYKDRPYDGEVAYADSVVGGFIGYLKKAGLYQNSIVIVVGDHGEGLGEHGEETHGIFLYDSTTHVPLIVKPDRSTGGPKVVEAQVRTIDLLPTILELVGIPIPSQLNGESLKSYLTGKGGNDRVAIGETDYPLRFGWAPLRSIRTQGRKYIESPKPEFYNLKQDPGERKNLFANGGSEMDKLKQILTETRNKIGDAPHAENAALPDPKDKIEEQNLLHRAMLASDDNRINDARVSLEEVLKLDAKSPTALRQLGELELQTEHHQKAAEYLKRSLEVRPDDPTAAYELGQALEKSGDFAGARDALEKSLKSLPGQLPARILLGNVYLALKDVKAAQDQFEAATLVDSNSTEAQIGLARSALASGNPTDAIAQLQGLAKAQPDDPAVFEALAEAYKAAGNQAQYEKAIEHANALRKKSAA
jgi:choline-sulfatase